jgi:hypothetical protein
MKAIIKGLMMSCILISCIDPIKLDADGVAGQLVVDGLITNQERSHTVRLSRSVNFDNNGIITTYTVPETGVIVVIIDDQGHVIKLTESTGGVYVTDSNVKGELGRSYKLSITSKDGKEYQSEPEKLFPVPVIDSILYKYVKIEKISESSGNVLQSFGFQISVATSDPINEKNFYRWKTDAIIEFFSNSEAADVSVCWYGVEPLETKAELSDDTYFNGNKFIQPVSIAPYERATRILINVTQYSMTQEAFRFWSLIRSQQQSTGSIFDPVPSKINGNVRGVNTDETVLGYFGASAVYEKFIVFNRQIAADFSPPLNAKPLLMGDCRTQEIGATNIRPTGF